MSQKTWTLALTSVAFFMVNISLLVVVSALPAIRHDLRADFSTLGWVINAYGLAFAAGVITAAALGDRLGRVKVLTAGLAVFTLASVLGGLSNDVTLLIVSRGLQGVGAAMIMPLSLTILSAAFPPERRGVVIGLWGGIAGIGVAVGPIIGGAVTQGLDWHWTFWLLVPVGAIVAVLSPLLLEESRGPASSLDLIGVALITVGAFGLTWGAVRGTTAGWTSGEMIGSFAAGALFTIAFAFWQTRTRSPLLPPKLFANVTFVAANVTGFAMTAALLGSAFLIIQYFQYVLRFLPLDAGIHWLPATATPIFVAPLAGALSDRVGSRPLMVVGLLLAAVGLAWTAAVTALGVTYAQLIVPLILVGGGISMALPTSPAAALGAVARTEIGKASGVNSTVQRFGGVFGVAISSAVFAAYGHIGTPASFTAGFRPATSWLAVIAVLGAASGLAVRSRRPAVAEAPAQVVSEAV
jgi:EmrB/QacA subfamily drug resistance transporter